MEAPFRGAAQAPPGPPILSHSKAIAAAAQLILVSAYYILSEEKPYDELGGDYFIRREDQERLTRPLVSQLERLGQQVTLEAMAAAAR